MKYLQERLPGFDDQFHNQVASVTVEAPGRMNLIGEHTDYNGGKVLPFAIKKTITLRALALTDGASLGDFQLSPGAILVKSSGFEHIFMTNWSEVAKLASTDFTDVVNLPDTIAKSWAAYAIGALYKVHQLGVNSEKLALDPPLLIQIAANLPAGAGISSSAALTTGLISLVARILDIFPDRAVIARLAMEIEHQFVGTKCGLMDQLAVLLAREDHLLYVDFHEFPSQKTFEFRHVQMHPVYKNYEIVGLNTGVKHNLSDSPYNERRHACEDVVLLLNDFFKVKLDSLGAYSRYAAFEQLKNGDYLPQSRVKELLQNTVLSGHRNRTTYAAYAAHAICENNRVDLACKALETGQVELLDQMLNEGHRSLDLDYGVSCMELNLIRSEARSLAACLDGGSNELLPIIGGRMTGGGFGGSVIQLLRRDLVDTFVDHFSGSISEYQQQTGIKPEILVTTPASGLTIS